MAEWALLILVFVVVAGTYFVTRFLYDTRHIVGAWVVAGLIIALGLFTYGASKVDKLDKGLSDRYQQIEEEP